MKGLVLAAICFAAFILMSAAASHVVRPKRMLNLFVACFAFLVLFYILVYLRTPANLFFLPPPLESRHQVVDLLYGCVVFSFFFHSFLCSYYVLGEGLSTCFLSALREAEPRGMTKDEVVGLFRRSDGTDKIIGWRLPRLAAKGYIKPDQTGASYVLTPKGVAVARLAYALKRLLNLGAGG